MEVELDNSEVLRIEVAIGEMSMLMGCCLQWRIHCQKVAKMIYVVLKYLWWTQVVQNFFHPFHSLGLFSFRQSSSKCRCLVEKSMKMQSRSSFSFFQCRKLPTTNYFLCVDFFLVHWKVAFSYFFRHLFFLFCPIIVVKMSSNWKASPFFLKFFLKMFSDVIFFSFLWEEIIDAKVVLSS